MITILVKRWYNKNQRDTYHSVAIKQEGKLIGFEPYAYGSGDGWKNTALALLQKRQILPTTNLSLPSGISKDMLSFEYALWKTKTYQVDVVDVGRKKDL